MFKYATLSTIAIHVIPFTSTCCLAATTISSKIVEVSLVDDATRDRQHPTIDSAFDVELSDDEFAQFERIQAANTARPTIEPRRARLID